MSRALEQMTVRIEHYEFGKIVVDGVEYHKDLKIYPDGVLPNWWRREGHQLQPEDLQELRDKGIGHLVVGQGAHGMMMISDATKHLFDELGMEWSAYPTTQAVAEYNRRSERGEKVGAAFHLTC